MRGLRLASSSLGSGWGTILLVGILGLNLQSIESARFKSGHLTVHRNFDASPGATQQNGTGVNPSHLQRRGFNPNGTDGRSISMHLECLSFGGGNGNRPTKQIGRETIGWSSKFNRGAGLQK